MKVYTVACFLQHIQPYCVIGHCYVQYTRDHTPSGR